MKTLIAWCVGGISLFFALTAFAAEQATPRQPVTLDTVVVTAKKTDAPIQTGDVDKEFTPVMVDTIEREEFEGQSENIAKIIDKEAGTQVRQSGGLGSFSSISLRGSSSDQVLVFMDGILLNDASGGGVDLSNISLSDVAAIDIYRGATPINFGFAGIGGAVNIRTLRAEKEMQASAAGGYGSFNTRKFNGFVNHKPGRWDYLISGDYLASDNDYEILNDNGTGFNPDDDRYEKRNNAQVEQANVLAKAGYDASDTLRLDLMNQFFVKDQGIPNWNNSPTNQTTLDTLRNIATAKLTADDLTGAHLNTSTQLSYVFKKEAYDDRNAEVGLGSQYNRYTTGRFKADLFAEWLGDWQDLIGTVNYLNETYESEDLLYNTPTAESQRHMVTVGLQDSLFLLDDALIVTPAARYTWLKDVLNAPSTTAGEPQAEETRNDGYLSPQIGVLYGPREWLKLQSNLARYVRQPSFFELFGDRGLFVGNPDLKEEKGLKFDIGTKVAWTRPVDWLQRLSFEIAYFRNDAEDLITRVYDARGIGKSVNISSALIQGIEFSSTVEFLKRLRAVVNYTYQDPRNESEIEAFDGKQLPGRFTHMFLGRLEARYAEFMLYGEHVRETGMYYDTANLLPAAKKNQINVGISWARGPWMLHLEGRNLTDQLYEDFNGFPMPGRSFYASVKFTFNTPNPPTKRIEP